MLEAARWCLVVSSVLAAQAQLDYARIQQQITTGDLVKAQIALERHLSREPDDFRALLLLGIDYDEQGAGGRALECFRKALVIQPLNPAPHINLAKHLATAQRLTEAAAELKIACKLDPKNSTSWGNLAQIEMRQKQFEPAASSFAIAVRLAPRDLDYLTGLVGAQLRSHRPLAANATARRMVEIAGASSGVYSRLAAIYVEAEDYAGAAEFLQQAARFSPASVETRYNLGLALLNAGNLSHASEVISNLWAELPSSENANLFADVLEKQGRYLDAVQKFQAAALMAPENEDFRFDYLYELLAHETYAAAILVGEPAAKDFPASSRIRLALAVGYFGATRYGDAQNCLLQTARDFPDSDIAVYLLIFAAEANHNLSPETVTSLDAFRSRHSDRAISYFVTGKLAAIRGDAPQSIALFERALQLDPKFADADDELGRYYVEKDQPRRAVEYLTHETKLRSDAAEVWYRLAQCQRKLGNTQKYERALSQYKRLKQRQKADSVALGFVYRLR